MELFLSETWIFPKKVKYKVRKTKEKNPIDDTGIYEGRTYKEFQAFIAENPDTRITEMDTVMGCEGSKKVLLTFHFCGPNFMMAFLLNSKEASEVTAVLDMINLVIGSDVFRSTFPLIVTDRGSEFKQPDALECSLENDLRTRIYYCDPMASWQKPHCEKTMNTSVRSVLKVPPSITLLKRTSGL